MAIKPIDSLPGGQMDAFNEARQQVVSDILQIIREGIPLCEITIKNYSENYYRSIIKDAIRKACGRYNDSPVAQTPSKVYSDMFEIARRKGDDGKHHWYIKYNKPAEEEG